MSNKQILIVDNNEALLDLFERHIRGVALDYQITTARDSCSALEQLQKQQIELIIADYNLPGMNGLEFSQAAHQLQPESHILLMSIQDTDEIKAKAQRLHLSIDGCLNKIALLMHLWECDSRK